MEGLGWILFFIVITPIALIWLFAMAMELDFKLRNPNAVKGKPPERAEPVPMYVPKPTLRVPFPQPQPQPPAPDYLRKWSTAHRRRVVHEHADWQRLFDGQRDLSWSVLAREELARRAGGLHGSSTAAPGSGGEGVPPQGSEPRIAQGARREGEAGASGEPPGRKNEKIWRKLSDTLSELERNGAGS